MNKYFKLLIAALLIISAAIQAKQIGYGHHLAVPITTIVLQLLILVLLAGNEIRQSGSDKNRGLV
jgi:hypothetical protein